MRIRIVWLSILVVLLYPAAAFGQRDSPVWESYLPKISIYHDDVNRHPALTIDFLFRKNGGPYEHKEHQAYVLVYLTKDEEEILKLAKDPQLINKKNEKTKLFLDLLVEKKLVVSLDSQVAKIGSTPRFPDVRGTPKSAGVDTVDQFSFAYKFTFTYDALFQSVQKLGHFNIENVNVVGSSTWFDDKFKLIVFVPVNDSLHATRVSQTIREAYDFAAVMNFNTALLYFRPLPYEFGFKKYQQDTLVYIN